MSILGDRFIRVKRPNPGMRVLHSCDIRMLKGAIDLEFDGTSRSPGHVEDEAKLLLEHVVELKIDADVEERLRKLRTKLDGSIEI